MFGKEYWIFPTYSAPYERADVLRRVLIAGSRHLDEASERSSTPPRRHGRSARSGRRRSSRRTAGTTCSLAPTTFRTTSKPAASASRARHTRRAVRGPSRQAARRQVSQRRAADRPVRVHGHRRHALSDLRRLEALQHREAERRLHRGRAVRRRHDVQGDHAGRLRRRLVDVRAATGSTTSCGPRAAGRGRTTRSRTPSASSPLGPFERVGKILQQDPARRDRRRPSLRAARARPRASGTSSTTAARSARRIATIASSASTRCSSTRTGRSLPVTITTGVSTRSDSMRCDRCLVVARRRRTSGIPRDAVGPDPISAIDHQRLRSNAPMGTSASRPAGGGRDRSARRRMGRHRQHSASAHAHWFRC